MQLILPIYSCLLGLFLAVNAGNGKSNKPILSDAHSEPKHSGSHSTLKAKPSDPQSEGAGFDIHSELRSWVNQPIMKKKIGTAYQLKGGWEGWAQVEIAIFLQEKLRDKGFEVTREDRVYEDASKRSDITVHQKTAGKVTILELKCESLRNKGKFDKGVAKDVAKIGNKIASAYSEEAKESTIWSVAIGTTGENIKKKLEGKPAVIEFKTEDESEMNMGIWTTKVVVKAKDGDVDGASRKKGATKKPDDHQNLHTTGSSGQEGTTKKTDGHSPPTGASGGEGTTKKSDDHQNSSPSQQQQVLDTTPAVSKANKGSTKKPVGLTKTLPQSHQQEAPTRSSARLSAKQASTKPNRRAFALTKVPKKFPRSHRRARLTLGTY
ncbi:hypothetical protein BDP27DRAFT_1425482 [Rhodocollybia butyracea]|uniref:Uncharacterized protein n=1 Tax=Rhodocollybia butyracea TaxID=206335 RepID=A0A9P5PGC5_9AGAR|nr:hypothetical protein BDP27DRAFT_1425482 [Rhodocollybia butyracea]